MQKETYSNDEILKIIEQYKKARERDKKQYQKHKDDPEFIEQNRIRANAYYQQNKWKVTQKYAEDTEYIKCRSLCIYYKTNHTLEIFKERWPKKYELLLSRGYIQ